MPFDISPELVSLVAFVWFTVRATRPYIDKVTSRLTGAVLHGRELWVVVFAVSFGLTALYGQRLGVPFNVFDVLWNSLVLSVGAIGADKMVADTDVVED